MQRATISHYDFVFDEEGEDTAGWKLDDQGDVIIDTTCRLTQRN
jgi:hypothetical protein